MQPRSSHQEVTRTIQEPLRTINKPPGTPTIVVLRGPLHLINLWKHQKGATPCVHCATTPPSELGCVEWCGALFCFGGLLYCFIAPCLFYASAGLVQPKILVTPYVFWSFALPAKGSGHKVEQTVFCVCDTAFACVEKTILMTG